MQFVTLVRLRPSATGILPIARAPGIYEMEWSRLSKQMQLVGGKIHTMLNVLGNDYDLLVIGEVEDRRLVPWPMTVPSRRRRPRSSPALNA